jgi:hypothetical protein
MQTENYRRAVWLHDQLDFQLKYGFKSLKGYAINQGPIQIVELPEIANLIGEERIQDRVYVKSLYAWVYKNKGINEDSHEIVRELAMLRIFHKLNPIPTLRQLMGIQTNTEGNY